MIVLFESLKRFRNRVKTVIQVPDTGYGNTGTAKAFPYTNTTHAKLAGGGEVLFVGNNYCRLLFPRLEEKRDNLRLPFPVTAVIKLRPVYTPRRQVFVQRSA